MLLLKLKVSTCRSDPPTLSLLHIGWSPEGERLHLLNVVSVITGHSRQAALSNLPQLGGTEGARAVEVVIVEPVPLLQSLELVSCQAPEGWTQYRP